MQKPKEKLAGELKVGTWASFRRPEGLNREDVWYGSDRPKQYNGSSVDGEVIRINKTNIKIKQTIFPEAWNYNHEYIVPKNAIALIPTQHQIQEILLRQKHKVPSYA